MKDKEHAPSASAKPSKKPPAKAKQFLSDFVDDAAIAERDLGIGGAA